MSEDIAHYKRAKYEPGNPVYSFEWLWAASCRHLLMKREEYMQQSLNKSLTGASKGAPGPDAPKGKGKGTNGPKGPRPKSPARPTGDKPKGDGRGRSESAGRGKRGTD